METLVSQAYGAGSLRIIGVSLQTAMFVVTLGKLSLTFYFSNLFKVKLLCSFCSIIDFFLFLKLQIFSLNVACIPLFVILWFTDVILIGLYQEPLMSKMAGTFIR